LITNEVASSTIQDDVDQEDLAALNLRLATNMVSTSSHFLAEGTGWLGPQRLFFLVRTALTYLKKVGSPVAADAFKAFMAVVTRLRSGCEVPARPAE